MSSIRYVYDYKNDSKRPIACIVKTSDNIGVSICRKDERFNKKRAIEIANGRAQHVNIDNFINEIPNRKIVTIDQERTTLRELILEHIDYHLGPEIIDESLDIV